MLRVSETSVAAQVFNMERRVEELERERDRLTRELSEARAETVASDNELMRLREGRA